MEIGNHVNLYFHRKLGFFPLLPWFQVTITRIEFNLFSIIKLNKHSSFL